jgi:hypothetical protein
MIETQRFRERERERQGRRGGGGGGESEREREKERCNVCTRRKRCSRSASRTQVVAAGPPVCRYVRLVSGSW